MFHRFRLETQATIGIVSCSYPVEEAIQGAVARSDLSNQGGIWSGKFPQCCHTLLREVAVEEAAELWWFDG